MLNPKYTHKISEHLLPSYCMKNRDGFIDFVDKIDESRTHIQQKW